MALDFRILGPLEVVDDGVELELGAQKHRTLLAVLLVHANEVVSTDQLIEALWEDTPPPRALKALQVYVSQLRKLIGRERLQTKTPGYLLRLAPDELDTARFERLIDEGQPRAALDLWRGRPLADFVYNRFAQTEIARLEELGLSALEARNDEELGAGRHAQLVGQLEALVSEGPLRERLRGQLMLALYRSGRQVEALEAYQDARRTLTEELGIEPGRELRDLQQRILNQDPTLDVEPRRAEDALTPQGLFVGRDDELAALRQGLNDALAGHGRLFLLVGEPGIGKSRLADELIQVARARGVDVLVGRCWEASGAPAYWPWVQALRERADDAPPELAALLHGEPADSPSESARFRLFDAIAELLRRLSRDRPLLLFLDDMHAADEPSLLLLRFVARQLGSSRMLLIVACRDVDPLPGRPLEDMLTEAIREPGTTWLSLRGLSEEAVADYVDAELASRELASKLYESTEGNPLFLGETVRLLALEGRIAIPPSLREVIARRLSHLSGECNRVLVLGAVLGREFDHAPLASMSNLSVDELLEILDEAMAARVVSDVPDANTRSRFAHVLIRDALYDRLSSARRVSLHRKAVDVLEDDAELAFHAMAANDFERARACAQRAGDRALALLAFEEAARLYEVALSAKPDVHTRCELLLSRGEAEIRAGDTSRARETFLAAAALARELGLPLSLARAALGYGGRIVWVRAGEDSRLVPLLEEALAALPADEVELRARLLARLAGALRDEHIRDRREALSNEAVSLAHASGKPAVLAYALEARAYAMLAPDTVEQCLDLAHELRQAAERAGDTERIVAGHMLAIMALVVLGDIAATETELRAATPLAAELGQRAQVTQIEGVKAMIALASGRLDEGETLSNERYELGKQTLLEASIAEHRCQRHLLYDLRGDLAPIEPEISELVERFPARPVFRCVLAHVHARTGRIEDAQNTLNALTQEQVAALPFDQEWLYGMSLLAETAAILDDTNAATTLYPLLLPWRKLNAGDVAEGCRGAISRYLGLLAATLGHPQHAAEHLEHAIAMNEQMGFVPWATRARNDYERTRDDTGVSPTTPA